MSSNMRITPAAAHSSSTNNLTSATKLSTSTHSAPAAPGVHDTLRSKQFGGNSASTSAAAAVSPHTHLAAPSSSHPLETRLLHWRATQHNLKMEGLRRQFGMAEPIRRGMELNIVRGGEFRAGVLGGSAGVHGDVLEGRDCSVEWEDIYPGNDIAEGVDFHTELEARVRMSQV